ncbi:MAG: SIS domain-containing protein [Opitutae bacterium]|jgi:D-sedoheptulose 7-phosphate isomerase|nr:SIS domain-containing protein [Opitutae bacterium]
MNNFLHIKDQYHNSLSSAWNEINWDLVKNLSDDLKSAWKLKSQVFICGNGGSAANANHLANDFLYGISPIDGKGLKVHSLVANIAVNTCLANDTGYENIFSNQLNALADTNDILIALSGSGNSPNIIQAINRSKSMGMKTHAILGFDGGKCKEIADNAIHIPIDNMQVAEDFQIIIGHILMLDLKRRN